MSSVRFAQIVDLAGRAVLVAIFAFVLTLKCAAVIGLLRRPEGPKYLELAAHIASVAFIALIVVMTVIRFHPIRSAEGAEPRVSALVGTGLSLTIPLLPLADIGVLWEIIALALIMIGWILSTYVLTFLGRSFSIMAQARSLVTTGPYSIVRHPLYLSEEIAVIGIAINYFSVEAVFVVVAQWLFQLRRMSNEEKVLRAVFPEYDDYAKRTPKVIPRFFPKFRLGHA